MRCEFDRVPDPILTLHLAPYEQLHALQRPRRDLALELATHPAARTPRARLRPHPPPAPLGAVLVCLAQALNRAASAFAARPGPERRRCAARVGAARVGIARPGGTVLRGTPRRVEPASGYAMRSLTRRRKSHAGVGGPLMDGAFTRRPTGVVGPEPRRPRTARTRSPRHATGDRARDRVQERPRRRSSGLTAPVAPRALFHDAPPTPRGHP